MGGQVAHGHATAAAVAGALRQRAGHAVAGRSFEPGPASTLAGFAVTHPKYDKCAGNQHEKVNDQTQGEVKVRLWLGQVSTPYWSTPPARRVRSHSRPVRGTRLGRWGRSWPGNPRSIPGHTCLHTYIHTYIYLSLLRCRTSSVFSEKICIVLCVLVRGGTSKKGHQKGHKWPFSVCVNLKKDPPPAN